MRTRRPVPGWTETPHGGSYAVMVDGPAGGAYSEEAFRYLLAIERKRAERSSRPFFLLLVDLKRGTDKPMPMAPEIASSVFSGLSLALRETDFIGWYREGRIAGAVLAQHVDSPDSQVARAVNERVKAQVCSQLPDDLAARVQTRVFQLPRSSRD